MTIYTIANLVDMFKVSPAMVRNEVIKDILIKD